MNIIENNEISIDSEQWTYLNQNNTKDEVKQIISDAIDGLPLPMRKISIEDAMLDFEKLKNFDASTIIKNEPFFSRYDYTYDFTDLLFATNNTGNKASDYFHQESRWYCDSKTAPSPYRSWTIEKFRLTLLNALWSLKVTEVNSNILRSIIGLRKYIASQFRPSTAKALYNKLGSEKVLDFSSGWGDRLCGFYASNAKSYTGIDPNNRLIQGYQNQISHYNDPTKTAKMINGLAEETDLGDQMFDTVFTSPPYYNIEFYTRDEVDSLNQSWKKFKKIDDWNSLFLHKAIGNAWKHLERGGHMVVNISDVYSNHTINQICNPMNDYFASLGDSSYVGCWGYEMRKRPNSKKLQDANGNTIAGKFAEPMWVWRKN